MSLVTELHGNERCNICGTELSDDSDSLAYNCGGDCMKCMAESGDPEYGANVMHVYIEQFYSEYSKLVNKFIDRAQHMRQEHDAYEERLQEHSNIYSRSADR